MCIASFINLRLFAAKTKRSNQAMLSTLELFSKTGIQSIKHDPRMDESTIKSVENHHDNVLNLEKDFLAEIKSVNKNDSLSSVGKRLSRRAIAEKFFTRFSEVVRNMTWSKKIDEAKAKLSSRPSDENPLMLYLQRKEIRDLLRQMGDGITIESRYDLMSGRYDNVLDALESAPMGFELLSQDRLTALVAHRQRRQNPELFHELQAMERAEAEIRSLNIEAQKLFDEFLDDEKIEIK